MTALLSNMIRGTGRIISILISEIGTCNNCAAFASSPLLLNLRKKNMHHFCLFVIQIKNALFFSVIIIVAPFVCVLIFFLLALLKDILVIAIIYGAQFPCFSNVCTCAANIGLALFDKVNFFPLSSQSFSCNMLFVKEIVFVGCSMRS